MMQKFGYVLGTGLGQNGEGIIVPISAQVLPPGRSLDHCMELREQANGDKNLFSVERRLKERQKKQEAVNVKAYEREKQKVDVFSFMNDSVFAGTASDTLSAAKKAPAPKRPDFKDHTIKNLNVAGFKIGEDIRKKEKEITVLKDSMARHKTGSPVHNKLKAQLAVRLTELDELRRSETSVAKEQNFRKDKSKLTIF